jgi:mRNA interferase RelE/StbE
VSEARWRVLLARAAEKDLDRLDPPVRKRVARALNDLANDPAASRGLKKLQGRPERRPRVGGWRVIVDLDAPNRAIRVKRVLPRGRAYDR